jgi:ribosomal protein S18 acetylase RimI-like enzyme
MDIKIRRAELSDLAKIQELNLELFKKERQEYDETLDEKWTFSEAGTKFFSNMVNDENNCAFVAEKDGRIIGYLAGSINKNHSWRKINKKAELENMFVLQEYRGQGFGGELVKNLKDWCKEKGVEKISVSASAANLDAIKFYKKQGFYEYDIALEMDVLS